jgi:hypothetical protein
MLAKAVTRVDDAGTEEGFNILLVSELRDRDEIASPIARRNVLDVDEALIRCQQHIGTAIHERAGSGLYVDRAGFVIDSRFSSLAVVQ